MYKNIASSRELIWQLFKRDFLMQYKKSFLGMGWILITPIIGIASWVFMNKAGILTPGDTGIPYPAYVLMSSTIWGLFMGYYSSAAKTLDAANGFIMQVKFPHEALLFKEVAQQLANFLIVLGLNIAVLLAFDVKPDWKIILLPILTLPMFFLASAFGLVLSVVNVVASDLTRLFGTFLSFVFYITPIIYVQDEIENKTLSSIIKYNPLTYLVGGVRDTVLYGRMENFDTFLILGICSFILFMLAWRLFYISEERVIEKMF